MAYVNQTLDALMKCVMRYGPTPQSRAAVAAWLKSPIGPAAGASDDPEIQKETSSLASAIISEAALPKASSLKPGDVPAGTRGNSVWKVGDSLLTVSILAKDKVPEIGDLADLIVGGEAQKCRGDFFSGTTLDVIETVSVARAYTNCQTQQAAASIYYLAMPRTQGGVLFADDHCYRRGSHSVGRKEGKGNRRENPCVDHSRTFENVDRYFCSA